MKIFSFFAGGGMLDLGFQDAGCEVVFVNEFKQEFMDSYRYARRNRNYAQPVYGHHVNDINTDNREDIPLLDICICIEGRKPKEGIVFSTQRTDCKTGNRKL